jgi:stringent starvation protein B
MRTRNFLVPQDLIHEFVEAIEENDFSNHIVGTTAESEIEISIDYDTDQRKVVNELQDMIDEHNYDNDDDDDDEDDD